MHWQRSVVSSAVSTSRSAGTWDQLLFLMFAAITLGGLGSAYGALLGGFLVGLFVETATLFGVPTELKTVPASWR